MQNANSTGNCSSSGDSSIVTFQADWHHELGHKLEVFPRCIPLGDKRFWPDLASFLEDHRSRQMMYYNLAPSTWSVQVIFEEEHRCWNFAVFEDANVIAETSGDSLAAVSEGLARG